MIRVIFFILLSVMVLISQPKAQDFDKVPDDEWPTQVIFDTVHVCYNGTLRWIAMGNPNLLNQPPPYGIARLMTVHCFCVLDKVRTQFKYRAYVDYIMQDKDLTKPTLIPKLFMGKSVECIRDFGTLKGLILLDDDALKALDEFGKDNETKIDKSEDTIPNNNSGPSDLPEQPEELTEGNVPCLLYTSPSPRDGLLSRMPSSA